MLTLTFAESGKTSLAAKPFPFFLVQIRTYQFIFNMNAYSTFITEETLL